MIDAPVLDRRNAPFSVVDLSRAESESVARALDDVYREQLNPAARNPDDARSVFIAQLYQLSQVIQAFAARVETLALNPTGFDVLHEIFGTVNTHGDTLPALASAWQKIHDEWRQATGVNVPDDDDDVACRACGHTLLDGGARVWWEQPFPDRAAQPDARCAACNARVDSAHEHFDAILTEARGEQ